MWLYQNVFTLSQMSAFLGYWGHREIGETGIQSGKQSDADNLSWREAKDP